MDIEALREFCLTLPHVTEDVKWGNDLCFCIAEKMFCVTGLNDSSQISFKVRDEEFEEVSSRKGFSPAPYVARYKWVLADTSAMSRKDTEHFIRQSYDLVKAKLPKKLREKLI
jgi:predicted DNA-binding protein (MmcQ/YjbR family)